MGGRVSLLRSSCTTRTSSGLFTPPRPTEAWMIAISIPFPLMIRFRPELYRKIKVCVPTMTSPWCPDHVTPTLWRLIKGKSDAVVRKPSEVLGNSDSHQQENDGNAATPAVRASHRNVYPLCRQTAKACSSNRMRACILLDIDEQICTSGLARGGESCLPRKSRAAHGCDDLREGHLYMKLLNRYRSCRPGVAWRPNTPPTRAWT